MSRRTLENVKGDRGFKLFDLIIYGVLVLIVAVSFIAVCATKNDSPLTGVRAYIEDVAVFEYSFENDSYAVKDGYDIEVKKSADKLEVKINAGGGYNLLEIDKRGSVKVVKADCRSGDCAYMPAITDNSGIIYCSPHRLKIVPFNFDEGLIII